MNHTCSAFGCREPVKRPKFMCKEHWFQVPKKIRDEVWTAHRARPFDRNRSLTACRDAISSVMKGAA